MSIRRIFLFLKKNKYQIIKFIIVGLISSLLNFLVYSLLYQSSINVNVASLAGYFIGILNSFFFSKNWIFNEFHSKRLKRVFILFTCLYIQGGIVMTIVINFGIYLFGNYKLAWLLGAGLAAINNYLGSKFLLFKN
tara:strand:- start:2186 stop:2593 length:408 start_codon:yes stop_codon:yes gene_type:complete